MFAVRTSRLTAAGALRARALLCVSFGAVVVALLLGGASPVSADAAAQGASQARIEPKVLDEIAAQGETTFWVNLHEQADLAPAHAMTDRDARGEFVFDQPERRRRP